MRTQQKEVCNVKERDSGGTNAAWIGDKERSIQTGERGTYQAGLDHK